MLVAVTAACTDAPAAGFDRHLLKPVDPGRLLAVVNALTARRPGETARSPTPPGTMQDSAIAEEVRTAAEALRLAAVTERRNGEHARDASASAREDAEGLRRNAEDLQLTAEELFQSAELARVAAKVLRGASNARRKGHADARQSTQLVRAEIDRRRSHEQPPGVAKWDDLGGHV